MSNPTKGPWRVVVRPYGRGERIEIWSTRGQIAYGPGEGSAREAIIVAGGYPVPKQDQLPNAMVIAEMLNGYSDWKSLASRLAEALREAAPVVRGASVTPGWPQAVKAQPLVDAALAEYDAATGQKSGT